MKEKMLASAQRQIKLEEELAQAKEHLATLRDLVDFLRNGSDQQATWILAKLRLGIQADHLVYEVKAGQETRYEGGHTATEDAHHN